MPGISKCECGSSNFEQHKVMLDLNILETTQLPTGQTLRSGDVRQQGVWSRFCKNCGSVTFWSRLPTK